MLGLWPSLALGANSGDFKLSLPIKCTIGKTCWIPNYVDLVPGKGLRDYNCGDATYNAPPHDQHKGTDFAVRDMAAVRRGVPVLAAAPGVVIGKRDGMVDIDFKIKGAMSVRKRECGNGVVIRHDSGITTQYCHMRQGSVSVNKGDMVSRKQQIGMVGLSGLSMFPHLHFQVGQVGQGNKVIIDPFVGLKRKKKCGIGEHSLWNNQALKKLPYQPTAIYNAGFAARVPRSKEAREGLYKGGRLAKNASYIILWADIFRVRNGDELVLKITGPKGAKMLEKHIQIEKNQARRFVYSGKRRSATVWPTGTYTGEIKLIRNGSNDWIVPPRGKAAKVTPYPNAPKTNKEFSIIRQIKVR